jgi:hypothetical protein
MFCSAAMRNPPPLLPMPCGHHTSRAKLGDELPITPKAELRRIHLPRTRVNKGKNEETNAARFTSNICVVGI